MRDAKISSNYLSYRYHKNYRKGKTMIVTKYGDVREINQQRLCASRVVNAGDIPNVYRSVDGYKPHNRKSSIPTNKRVVVGNLIRCVIPI